MPGHDLGPCLSRSLHNVRGNRVPRFGPEFVGRVERVLNAVAKPGLCHGWGFRHTLAGQSCCPRRYQKASWRLFKNTPSQGSTFSFPPPCLMTFRRLFVSTFQPPGLTNCVTSYRESSALGFSWDGRSRSCPLKPMLNVSTLHCCQGSRACGPRGSTRAKGRSCSLY